jgi:hypothetical protein
MLWRCPIAGCQAKRRGEMPLSAGVTRCLPSWMSRFVLRCVGRRRIRARDRGKQVKAVLFTVLAERSVCARKLAAATSEKTAWHGHSGSPGPRRVARPCHPAPGVLSRCSPIWACGRRCRKPGAMPRMGSASGNDRQPAWISLFPGSLSTTSRAASCRGCGWALTVWHSSANPGLDRARIVVPSTGKNAVAAADRPPTGIRDHDAASLDCCEPAGM